MSATNDERRELAARWLGACVRTEIPETDLELAAAALGAGSAGALRGLLLDILRKGASDGD